MKYEFQCGGDHGAWECLVDVDLSTEESSILNAYAQKHEFLDYSSPVKMIYTKVIDAIEAQCDEETDMNNIVIWVPFGLRKDQ